MISLDSENARSGREVCRRRQQRRSAVIGGDADIFENIRADEEGLVVGVWAESRTIGNIRGSRERLKRSAEIDRGLSDGGCAESTEQQFNVLALFDRGFDRVGTDSVVLNGTMLPPVTVPGVPTVPESLIVGAPAAVDIEVAMSIVVPKAAR